MSRKRITSKHKNFTGANKIILENGETVLKIERSKFRTAEMASKYGALYPQHFLTLFEALTINVIQLNVVRR